MLRGMLNKASDTVAKASDKIMTSLTNKLLALPEDGQTATASGPPHPDVVMPADFQASQAPPAGPPREAVIAPEDDERAPEVTAQAPEVEEDADEDADDAEVSEDTGEALAVDAAGIREKVIGVLRSIYDPEIPVDIYELGLIYSVEVDEQNCVEVDMTLTSPACPVAGSLPPEVEFKIAALPEVEDVHVQVVWDPPWTPELMSEAAKLELNIW